MRASGGTALAPAGHNGAVDHRAAERSSRDLLRSWAASPGRAVACRVVTPERSFHHQVQGNTAFPAASLLKVPLAIAAEDAIRRGDLTGTVPVAALRSGRPGALEVLAAGRDLTPTEVLGLAIALSDNDSATWLYRQVGMAAVREVLARLGCAGTRLADAERPDVGPLTGVTTADDARTLVTAAADPVDHPLVAHALRNSIQSSRIPLGATEADVRLAHKTGSLAGVAHDAAVIDCDTGTLHIAFLSRDQGDTLVTGYEMGICTRELLEVWGLGARTTTGLA